MSAEVLHAAFARFVDALHQPREAAVVAAAVHDDVELHRHAPGARGEPTAIAESFTGLAAVAGWLARTPAVVRFSLVGAPVAADGAWSIEYAIDAGEFHNGGVWLARLADDGRIAFLSHHPFALPAGV